MGVYFSELQGKPVQDRRGKKVGVFTDMVFSDGEKQAKISHIVFKDKKLDKLPMRYVDLVGKSIKLSILKKDLKPESLDQEDFTITKYIMDKQVVDIDGLKVVRVNDACLDRDGDDLVLHSVDIGTRGMMRRLGLTAAVFLRLFGRKARSNIQRLKSSLVPWEYVQPLHSNTSRLMLKVPKIRMNNLHPADIADLMEDLSSRERVVVLRSLKDEQAAETLGEAHPDVQESLLRDMRLERIIEILDKMRPEQAADLLKSIPEKRAKHLLRLMKKSRAAFVKEIMAYPEDSAGSFMQTDYIALPEKYTVTKTINLLRKVAPPPNKVYNLYVVDKARHLVGILSLRLLLISKPKTLVKDIMRKNAINVKVETSRDDVARLLIKYDLVIVPVVDDQQRLKGVVTAYEVLTEVSPKSWKLKIFFPTKGMGKVR
ncbi:MAG: CBS domain-containing protein [Nanoarchaeota archaeon]|nr:CBS domain-containing protein [Nanoarchaeota archaeon]